MQRERMWGRIALAALLTGLMLGGFAGTIVAPGQSSGQIVQGDLQVSGRISSGIAGFQAGSLTLYPPDGGGWYHLDNPGGQQLRISGGESPGSFPYLTIAHPGIVSIYGDLNLNGSLNALEAQPLAFKTNGLERMRIDTTSSATTRIGIGTTTPETTLHIVGDELRMGMPCSGVLCLDQHLSLSSSGILSTELEPLIFKTRETERMRITEAGKIGIQTTTPSSTLSVAGDADFYGIDIKGGPSTSSSCSLSVDTKLHVVAGGGLGLPCPNAAVFVEGDGRGGVAGYTNGDLTYGVVGRNSKGSGVLGLNGDFSLGFDRIVAGVEGHSKEGIGVYGESVHIGVFGASFGGDGVLGRSSGGNAVIATIEESKSQCTSTTDRCNIFIGQTGFISPVHQARIDNSGKGFFNGGTQVGGADFAESIRTTDDLDTLEPGDVLAIDPDQPRAVRKSTEPNSPLVAGIYSSQPSVLAIASHHIDESLIGEVPMAVLGIVLTKATTEGGPIRIGDLLVTASTPGHAMRAPTNPAPGTILGKALSSLAEGQGVIEVLIMLR